MAELLAELRELRQTLAPKHSIPVLISNGTDATGGSLTPTLTNAYQDAVKWLPQEPGGILKQILLQGGLKIAYQIFVNAELVATNLIFGGTAAFDAILDFKRKKISPATKTGVLVQVKANPLASPIPAAPNVLLHGEQVIEW